MAFQLPIIEAPIAQENDPYTYTIFLADLLISKQPQKELVTPFKTESQVCNYLLDSWMIGLLPLEIIGNYLQKFHNNIYNKYIEDGMIFDWSSLNTAQKQEVHSEIQESLKNATNLLWFIDELPKSPRWPYLCYKRGAGTHSHVMMTMLKNGTFGF